METIKSKGSLERICVAHQNTAVLKLIMNEMKKRLEPISVDGVTLIPDISTVSATVKYADAPHEEQPVNRQCGIPCGFRTSDNIVVLIHKSDITELHVDAIVNAVDEVLGCAFGISSHISDAAGPELEQKQRAIVERSGPISLSHAVITSAGELPCQYVIHAVVAYRPAARDDEKEKHCRELLRDTITNIIQTADEHQLKSIALPAVITGKTIQFFFKFVNNKHIKYVP